MTGMTVSTRHASIGVGANPPFLARLATIILVALKAGLASFGWLHLLEATNQARFFAAGADVLTGGTMTRFTRLLLMNVRLVMLDVRFVTGGTELIVVDHLRFRDFWNCGPDLGKFSFSPAWGGLHAVGHRFWGPTISRCRLRRAARYSRKRYKPIKLATIGQPRFEPPNFLTCTDTIPSLEYKPNGNHLPGSSARNRGTARSASIESRAC